MVKSGCTIRWILALQNGTYPFWSYGHYLAAGISSDKGRC